VVEKALTQLRAAIPQFEGIGNYENWRKQIIACVVNAVVDAALAARSGGRGTSGAMKKPGPTPSLSPKRTNVSD
jgi:hypothetical protein